MVQWLGLGAFTAVAWVGSIPGWGTKIQQTVRQGQKEKRKKRKKKKKTVDSDALNL